MIIVVTATVNSVMNNEKSSEDQLTIFKSVGQLDKSIFIAKISSARLTHIAMIMSVVMQMKIVLIRLCLD